MQLILCKDTRIIWKREWFSKKFAKTILCVLPFTLHLLGWNPSVYRHFKGWRVDSDPSPTLHHPSRQVVWPYSETYVAELEILPDVVQNIAPLRQNTASAKAEFCPSEAMFLASGEKGKSSLFYSSYKHSFPFLLHTSLTLHHTSPFPQFPPHPAFSLLPGVMWCSVGEVLARTLHQHKHLNYNILHTPWCSV